MTATHRFSLEPYKGVKTRYNCPQCTKKVFTRYIDTVTGEHVAHDVGLCSRVDNCGHHYTPKQFFADNPELSNKEDWRKSEAYKKRLITPSVVTPILPPSYIPSEAFKCSFRNYEGNNFVKYLQGLFGDETTKQLIEKYYIGTSDWQFQNRDFPNYRSPKGANVFWQIDSEGKIRTGKIMLYSPDTGKRVKEPFNHIQWEHKALRLDNFTLKQCFYGEHLLKADTLKPVAIVESEKTAIIASVYLPQFMWLAIGSLTNLTDDRCKVLQGRNVVLYPDLNAFDKWSIKAKEFSSIVHFTVSDLLERKASEAESLKGLDLADYLIKFDVKDFQEAPAPIEKVKSDDSDASDSKNKPFFSPCKDKEDPAVEHRVYENAFYAPSVLKPQSWKKDIADLEKYFAAVILPTEPIRLNNCTIISDVSNFIDTHLETVKANNGKKTFLPYLKRLEDLRHYFVTNLDIHKNIQKSQKFI